MLQNAYLDGYHLSLAYLLTLDTVLRDHIGALYDVKKDVIIFEGLNKPFQTSTSSKTTRLAFNLWNGTVYDSDPPETYIDKDGEKAHRGYETGTGHNGTAKGRKRLRMDRMPQ